MSTMDEAEKQEDGDEGRDWAFGGTATRKGMGVPVCKHILAALLGKAAPGMFGEMVSRREAGKEEVAGWGGGWGDHG